MTLSEMWIDSSMQLLVASKRTVVPSTMQSIHCHGVTGIRTSSNCNVMCVCILKTYSYYIYVSLQFHIKRSNKVYAYFGCGGSCHIP